MRLSIDLSQKRGSLALHGIADPNPTLIGSTFIEGENRHSELLLSELAAFFTKHSCKPEQLTELVTCLGPGSFTGMRIAIATAKALAVSWKLPLFLVSGSEARARAYKKRNPAIASDILVITRVASKTFAQASLESNGLFHEDEAFEIDGISLDDSCALLADSEETRTLFDSAAKVFPICAEYLGEQFDSCTQNEEARTFAELVNLTPKYYGSSRF